MSNADTGALMEQVFLRSDNGSELSFQGQLYSESSYFDEESSSLTRLRLFLTKDKELVYSIIATSGVEKTRRHYTVVPMGELCRISDGMQTLTLPAEMLFAAVFGLCGINPERAEELKPAFEENLRMALA